MRADRLKRLWPKIEKKVKAVAIVVLTKFGVVKYKEVDEVLPEALMAIKRINTSRKAKISHSYIITRAKYGIIDYLRRERKFREREILLQKLPE